MISETRAYIKSRMKECDSSYREMTDLFGDDDVNKTESKNGYKVIFGPLSSEYIGNNDVSDTIPLTVEIYKALTVKKEIKDYDEAYDLAIKLKNNIIDPFTAKNNDFFNEIIPTGITPTPLQTNDKIIKMTLTFQVRTDLAFVEGE